MTREIVFMLEEASMKGFLKELLPRHFPSASFHFIPHEGKSDLERSLPKKLKAWRSPAIFIVVRDQDAGDCRVIKKHLADIVTAAGRSDTVMKRIIPAYQKLSGSRSIGQHADPALNASPSFRALFAAVQRLAAAPLPQGSEWRKSRRFID